MKVKARRNGAIPLDAADVSAKGDRLPIVRRASGLSASPVVFTLAVIISALLLSGSSPESASAGGGSSPCHADSAGSTSPTSHDISLDGLRGATRIRDSQAKTYTAIVSNHNLLGAEDIQVCLVVSPLLGCPAPEIDVALPYDATPGEPDNAFVDVTGDGALDSVALAVAHGILPDRSERVKATVLYSSCPPAPIETALDYIVIADACHAGDHFSKGFFNTACPDAFHDANDPDQANDAPIQRAVEDVLRKVGPASPTPTPYTGSAIGTVVATTASLAIGGTTGLFFLTAMIVFGKVFGRRGPDEGDEPL